MRAIITVTGKDHPGIVAGVSTQLAKARVNILDVSQTLMEEYFTMILLCDFSSCPYSLPDVQEQMKEVEKKERLVIRIQSEEIFNAMHTL